MPITFDGRTGAQIAGDINAEFGAALQLTESGLTLTGNSLTAGQAGNVLAGLAPGPAAPTGDPTVATSGAGSLTGTYYWKVTFKTADGETECNTASQPSLVCASNSVQLSSIPVSSDPTVIARCIYRNSSTVSATQREALQLVAEIADNTTTTYLDNVADGALGRFIPRISSFSPRLVKSGKRYLGTSNISTAIGQDAMAAGTGYACTAVGANAMPSVAGDRNTAIGVFAAYSLTLGRYNTAIGVHALNFSTLAESVTAIGYGASYTNTGKGTNTAIGAFALYSFNHATAGGNTAVGYLTEYNLTTGENNTAVGERALNACTTGSQNTAVGFDVLKLINGNFNTAMGLQAGKSLTSGNFNTVIGWGGLGAATGVDGVVAIGAYAGSRSNNSNRLYIDNQDRTNSAGDDDLALISGQFAATAAAQRLRLNATVKTLTTTVSALPAASIGAGYRAFVTDANATTFASVVAAGGANGVPVYSDGTNWRIG